MYLKNLIKETKIIKNKYINEFKLNKLWMEIHLIIKPEKGGKPPKAMIENIKNM